MKRFHELTKEDQKTGFEKCLGSMLKGLISGEVKLDDQTNGDNCQAVIDRMRSKAAAQNDMRLAVGWIMEATYKHASGEDKPLADEVSSMARAEAEESWYPDELDKLVFLRGTG